MNACVAPETLEAYASLQLDDAKIADIESHLESCEHCCVRLSQIVQSDESRLIKSEGGSTATNGSNASPAYQFWSRQQSLPQDSQTIPVMIGRYRVEKLLGSGGFGKVFLATDEKLDRKIAIKVPHANSIAMHQQLALILAEAKTVASLDHPCIVPIYDVGSSEEYPLYLVTKLINGQNLALRQLAAISQPELVGWTIQIAEALAYAHKNDVVHRDIKPHNILIDGSGNASLTDFGLARRLTDDCTITLGAGTPAYMSPEQKQAGRLVDYRTDIYSLGCVLVEMLLNSAGTSVRMETREALEKLRSRISPELLAICERATASQPEARFASAIQMAQRLRHFADQQGWSAIPKTLLFDNPSEHKPSRQFLQSANWSHWIAICTILAAACWCMSYWKQASEAAQQFAEVDSYLTAVPTELTSRLTRIRGARDSAQQKIQSATSSTDSDVRLRAQLALVNRQPELVEPLSNAMIGAHADLAVVLAKELVVHKNLLRDKMLGVLRDEGQPAHCRLNASAFLTLAFFDDPLWKDRGIFEHITRLMLQDELVDLPTHACAHQSHKARLIPVLKAQVTCQEDRSTPSLARVFEVWDALVQDDFGDCLELLLECPVEMADRITMRLKDHAAAFERLREIVRQQPDKPDDPKSALQHRNRFMAAYALNRLGSPNEFWELWQHSPNPDSTTVASHVASDSMTALEVIFDHLIAGDMLEPIEELPANLNEQLYSSQFSIRRQLIHALARRGKWRAANPAKVAKIVSQLRKLIIHDTDSGMQAQASWVLKGIAPPEAWHKEEWFPLDEVRSSTSQRLWSVNSLGMVLVHIVGAEQVDHKYCLGQREVEVRHFEQFLNETQARSATGTDYAQTDKYDAEYHKPQNHVSWFDCAAFCNWLSRREGLEECYLPNQDGQYATGMRVKPDVTKLNGYRLPLSAEWEIGCRAGANSCYSTGYLERYVAGYAWTKQNTLNLAPTGHMPPNAFGLFDMHGNVSEWMLDRPDTANANSSQSLEEPILDSTGRIARGGDYQSAPRATGSDSYCPQPALTRRQSLGFRLARTLPE